MGFSYSCYLSRFVMNERGMEFHVHKRSIQRWIQNRLPKCRNRCRAVTRFVHRNRTSSQNRCEINHRLLNFGIIKQINTLWHHIIMIKYNLILPIFWSIASGITSYLPKSTYFVLRIILIFSLLWILLWIVLSCKAFNTRNSHIRRTDLSFRRS